MILKTKSRQNAQSPQAIAGQQQEQNVAFFLRRAFKDHPQVLVINDFKFRFNDETAQIDHLIIYTYGFVLVESKSIKGQVQVNQQEEWTRSHQSKWFGMPSPIKQVELQQALLLELLMHHRSDILGKLLGIKQQGFKLRGWDHLCAVSSDAVINRDTMPKAISEKLVKTEFLVDKLKEIMNLKNKFMRVVNFNDTRPDFSQTELNSVGEFLISQDISGQTISNQACINTAEIPNHSTPTIAALRAPTSAPDQKAVTALAHEPIASTQESAQVQEIAPSNYQNQNPPSTTAFKLSCKHCGESNNYTPMHGKFGYYIHCNQCTKNTPMKQACPQCKSKNTKVQKRKESYTLNCQECSYGQQII